jgi:hypothetical protein
MPRKRNVSQDKFIQNVIMDAILVQIETEKDVRYLSLDAENKSCMERSALQLATMRQPLTAWCNKPHQFTG